jgi:hypothetical protein
MLAIATPADEGMTDEQTAINVATRLKQIWLDTYPENVTSFAQVSYKTRHGRRFTFKQRPFGDEEGVDVKVGRIRGAVGYCDGLNNKFQGLASDVIKDALWKITRACYLDEDSPLYGCRPWVLVHDEIGIEGPAETAHIWAWEFSRLMVEALARYCPDVRGEAEPALCRRWLKGAEAQYDEGGRLVPDECWYFDKKTEMWTLDHCWGVTATIPGKAGELPSYKLRLAAEQELGVA